MIAFCRPKVLQVDDGTVKVKIKLRRRTKNHLGSMYFGALAIGADLTAGIHAFYFAAKYNKQISFAFKGMNASFLKRAESHVFFETNEGYVVHEAVNESIATGERVNCTVKVFGRNRDSEVVAQFEMIVSIKVK